MNKKKIGFVGILSLIVFVIIGAVLCWSYWSDRETEVYSLYSGDVPMWEHIFEQGEDYHKFDEKPLGVILPHHMMVASELARFYNGLARVADPSTVYVIGPNHYETGSANIQTCENCLYKTTLDGLDSDLRVDGAIVRDLAVAGIAEVADDGFWQEHSIFSHAAFIKKSFPKAKVVPIMLQWEIPEEEVLELSEWLNENLSEDDLVIASVDFSHYLPEEVADFHDESSFATISNFDFDNIYDLEIDSPSSIYLLLDLMQRRGYEKAKRFAHTNVQDFMKVRQARTTSHQFFGFFKGDKEVVKGISVLSFVNIPESHVLGLVDDWNWDRDYEEEGDETVLKYLKDIKGEEDRFLTGSDFTVFDLEDGVCEWREQNELSISFCKLSEGVEYEKEVGELIRTAKGSSDFVYLLYQFDGGELTEQEKGLVKGIIDNGVDVFVGRGIEGAEGEEGVILGNYFTVDEIDLYEFPIELEDGYPRLK